MSLLPREMHFFIIAIILNVNTLIHKLYSEKLSRACSKAFSPKRHLTSESMTEHEGALMVAATNCIINEVTESDIMHFPEFSTFLLSEQG